MNASAFTRFSEEAGITASRGLAGCVMATEQMLEAARLGDWPKVALLEAARSQQLHQCFQEPVKPEHAQVFAEALALMLHMNEELVSLLNYAKSAAAIANSEERRHYEAVGHYLDVVSESSDND